MVSNGNGSSVDIADGHISTSNGVTISKNLTGAEQVQAIGSGLQDGGDAVSLFGYGATATGIGAVIGTRWRGYVS